MLQLEKNTEKVRQRAKELGFDACGFSKARRLEKHERLLEEWLHQDRQGQMQWMNNHFDKRVDPTKLVPGSKSVVSVICNYNTEKARKEHEREGVPKITKYAMGTDYHFVLKEKLFELFEFTRELHGGLEGRVFTDSAPVLDRAWAAESGLGWIGKHSLLLRRGMGSFFFIGEMIVDVPFSYDHPTTDHCGTCTRCIDACPTDAIYEPHKVDGSKCISYLTIELKDQIPEHFHEQMGEWMFGCDICQDVCPWNRKSPQATEEKLFPRDALLHRDLDFWEELDLDHFRELFRKNPVKRTKFEGLKRNLSIVNKNV